MIHLTRIVLIAALMAPAAPSRADDFDSTTMPAERFLAIARNPRGRESWAVMTGEISHRRRGAETKSAPIRLAIRFTPARTLAQIQVGGIETYLVSQAYRAGGDATTVIRKDDGDKSILADFGVRPQDLTMSFLFWGLTKELEPDSARGRNCRVFLLQSPDGKSETVHAHISTEYFFPLRVKWFRGGEGKAYRDMDADSFKQVENFWFPKTLSLSGPGWRTRVEFSEFEAGYTDTDSPAGIFKTTPPAAPVTEAR